MAHSDCCVPGCNDTFRKQNLHFYRIPKDHDIRKEYLVLIRHETLKLDCKSTRICSAHYD